MKFFVFLLLKASLTANKLADNEVKNCFSDLNRTNDKCWPHISYCIEMRDSSKTYDETPVPALQLGTICGGLSAAGFGKFNTAFGLAKDERKLPIHQDIFFDPARHHLDAQKSEKIIDFVNYLSSQVDTSLSSHISRTRSGRSLRRHGQKPNHSDEHKNPDKPRKNLKGKPMKGRRMRNEVRNINSESFSGSFWPWHVHIFSYQGDTPVQCSGMLLSSSVVITTAQCFKEFDFAKSHVADRIDTKQGIHLYTGFKNRDELHKWIENKNDGSHIQKSSSYIVHIHEHWLSGFHNVAVIKLNENDPFILNDHVKPICLPSVTHESKPKSVSLVAGFGGHQQQNLKLILAEVLRADKCRKNAEITYSREKQNMFKTELDRLHFSYAAEDSLRLCLGTRRKGLFCNGDDTSAAIAPFENRFVLIGLATIRQAHCDKSRGNPKSIEMYTRVSKLRTYIDDHITGWSAWTSWSDCAAKCGDSFKYRVRICESYSSNPVCEGNYIQNVTCTNGRCANWNTWLEWESCDCGQQQKQRARYCSPGTVTKTCPGNEIQNKDCVTEACKPSWYYNEWTDCTCLSINSTRTKECKVRIAENDYVNLADTECDGLPVKPLERTCIYPEDKSLCNIFITGGIRHGWPFTDLIFTPSSLLVNRDFDIQSTFRYGHCMVVLDGRVFIVGGRHSSGELATEFLELSTTQTTDSRKTVDWQPYKEYELHTFARMNAGCTVNHATEEIWMCGGTNLEDMDSRSVQNCVSFSFLHAWQKEGDLAKEVQSPTLAWYQPDNSIFMIGGMTDVSYNSRLSNEVRKYMHNEWNPSPPLPNKVEGAQSLVINERIYVIGGGQTRIFSIHPTTESSWTVEGILSFERTNFAAVRIGPRIWIFGGSSKDENAVEMFDTTDKRMITKHSIFPTSSNGPSAVLLPKSYNYGHTPEGVVTTRNAQSGNRRPVNSSRNRHRKN